MKSPPDTKNRGSVVAMGYYSRRKRDEKSRTARAEMHCAKSHTLNECNGTETLALIERALVRLSSGTYGSCVSCGDDISLMRLEQNPAVETCASCSQVVSFKAC